MIVHDGGFDDDILSNDDSLYLVCSAIYLTVQYSLFTLYWCTSKGNNSEVSSFASQIFPMSRYASFVVCK
jgi:hypothetical protein